MLLVNTLYIGFNRTKLPAAKGPPTNRLPTITDGQISIFHQLSCLISAQDTPLLLASRNGHDDVISVLIERGADVAACDKRGRNCLSLAIDKGHR